MKNVALLLPLLMVAAIISQSPPAGGLPPGLDLVFTEAPLRSDQHQAASSRFLLNRATGTGSRLLRLWPDGHSSVLTPEFSAAADPAVSFDAHRILFAGQKRPGDRWNIWEMDIDGGNKKQITRDFGDCREPEYLAKSAVTPPDFADKVRWITFTSSRTETLGKSSVEGASSLYVMNLEPIEKRGTVIWRTTFNLCRDFSPVVLRDGRVLFSSELGCGGASPIEFPLLAANWDGSGANLFCGSEQGGAFKTMAVETPDRNLVFVESAGSAAVGGHLARVAFRRPLHSYELLSRDSGDYLNPRPLPDGKLIVSYTPGTAGYGLYLFDFQKGTAGEKIFGDPRWEALDAQPVVQRPEPQGLISSVIDSLQWGDLFCLSVYDSDLPAIGRLKRGDVKTARFFAAAGGGDRLAHDSARLLGEIPIEEDGSFFARVPADTPLRMQLVDAEGKTLQEMNRWIWVRRGTSQGCIGCHENRELGPENRVPAAILRGEPYDMTSGRIAGPQK